MNDTARELLERALGLADYIVGQEKLATDIRAYLAEENNAYAADEITDQQRNLLLYGFVMDCNAIGPKEAGVNLAKAIKALIKNHGIGGEA